MRGKPIDVFVVVRDLMSLEANSNLSDFQHAMIKNAVTSLQRKSMKNLMHVNHTL